MKDLLKNKMATSLVVVATVILAGVAIFTALRLYQLRTSPVSPTAPSEPLAWYCDKYVFAVDGSGTVTVRNDSSRSEPPQQAVVYINNIQVATFNVPALPQRQSATLGTVEVPGGEFNWRVVGTIDCSSSGAAFSGPSSCELLTFTITTPSNTPTQTPTPTSTPSPTSTNTPTPTDVPPSDCNDTCTSDSNCSDSLICHEEGGDSYCRNPECTGESSCSCPAPTNTPSPTEPPRGGEETPTPTDVPATNTPTPTTGGEISAISPTPGGTALPDAGVGLPTVLSFGLGLMIVAFAILLAL